VVNRWIKHLRRAGDAALASIDDRRKSYIGAVIANKNMVVGQAVNSNDPHPFLRRHYPWYCGVHAEAGAIITATRRYGDIRGLDLFVTRIYRTGEIAPDSKPCSHCMALIAMFGIRRIFFTEGGKIKAMMVNNARYDDDYPTLGMMEIIGEKLEKV